MIFYLTATGNSKYAADRFRKDFPGEMIDVNAAIKENRYSYDVKDEEIVFFVFPVWYYSIPHKLKDFISKVDFGDKKPKIAAVGTCGSSSGSSDVAMRKVLKKKGLELGGFYEVVMPENYCAMFKVPLKEEQIMIIRRADKALNEIVDSIKYNFRVTHKSSIGMRVFSWLAGKLYTDGRPAKKFYADEKCIGCGICAKVCTDEIIKIENGKSEWTADRCCHCMACINRCPSKAIQYGKVTQKRERYVNDSLR